MAIVEKSRTFLLGLSVCILGLALGYGAGRYQGAHRAAAIDMSYNLERAQENGEFEALAYFHCLQAMDSGNLTNLHAFALGQLRYYAWNVQQLREQGHAWSPHNPWLYSNATVYVAEHPQKIMTSPLPPARFKPVWKNRRRRVESDLKCASHCGRRVPLNL
jgi:hypothetical protein